jgi:XisI protein
MDRLTRYRQTVRNVLQEFADWVYKPGDPIQYELVHDPILDHFELVECGWKGRQRIHGVIYHLDIIDGKTWIQYDATDRPIATQLVQAGIPHADIVLAEKPADVRPLTGYGVG